MENLEKYFTKSMAVLLTLALIAAALAGLAPANVQAQSTPYNLAVVSQNVILNQGGPVTVNVPIALTGGGSGPKVSSAAFSLDYDSACLAYSAVDFSGISADFEKSVTNNNADTDGELDIAIFDQDSPKAEMTVPSTVVTVTFTVLPLCQVDGSTPVNFSTAPAASLGNPGGQPLNTTTTNGQVTIDWNRAATALMLSAATLAENQPANSTVGVISNNDPDGANDTYTYALVAGAGDTDNSTFAITGATLSAIPSFNFEVKKEYSVRIQVSDGKGGVYAQQFTITVIDVNEAPTSLALDNNSVVEDMGSAGQAVATVSVTDPDNADSYSTPDIFTLALAGADANYFEVAGMQIKVKAAGLETAETKSSYTFDVIVTDNAGNVYTVANTYTQAVTFVVINHSEFSIRVATARPPLWTTMGGQVMVPVSFAAKGNAVRSSSFQVTFDDACLSFAGVTGTGANGSATGGVATITGASSADYTSGDLFTLTFNADGACAASDDLTNPIYTLALSNATVANASSAALPVYTFDGQLYVIPNDGRGDCNSDGFVNAADFTAIALEIFDDADSSSADDGYWLNAWSVYSPPLPDTTAMLFRGSPQGCDASPHVNPGLSWIQVADILCTVQVVFGDNSCTVPSTARSLRTPAPASLTVSAVAGEGATVDVALNLASGNSAAGAAFSLSYDPAQMTIDPTDADQDGIPDAITINGPADFLKLAQVSFLNDQVDFALVDTTAPLSTIGDGVLATVRFTKIGAGEPKVTVTNVSVGDSAATTMPVVVEYGQDVDQAIQRLFLPAVTR